MMWRLMRIVIVLLMPAAVFTAQRDDTVQQALEYVFKARENCIWGTLEPLPLLFDTTSWNYLTDPAIRTANLLSKLLVQHDGSLDSLDDRIIFLMVRNNVHGDSLIFGSAIGFEKYVYSRYNVFCPYAYKENGTVKSHDLASNYDCHDPRAEWYHTLKVKPYPNLTMVADKVEYRNNDTYFPEIEEIYPVAELADGYWTKPYYDCGGGEIWMVTYSAPFFKIEAGNPIFQGVVTIDIELNKIDINQCDPEYGEPTNGLDVFMGSHLCQPTTKCVPITGLGFVTGAYNCTCKDGFYFPTTDVSFFSGATIEQFYRDGLEITPDMFRCLACAAGCDTCVDDSPCLYERNEAVLIVFTFFIVATIFGIIGVSAMIFIYRSEMAIKTASPIFLQLMCLGGVIMCCQFFVLYPEASLIVCYIRIWPKHVGFVVMYGSLILKTWRISVIFTVGTQKRVRLPDQVLIQRFCLIVLLCLAMLVAWTTSQPPKTYAVVTGGGLKFYDCDFGPWEYAALGVEIIFLLYGVYLCFTVRKVPAHFNESKHITWAVYNAIILGTFMAFMSNLVESVIGPDLGLLLEFIQIQVYVTVTLTLLFAPKFFALYKKTEDFYPRPDATLATNSTIQTITGRMKKTRVAPVSSLDLPP